MGKFKIVLKGEEDPIIIGYKEGIELAEDIRHKKVVGLIKVADKYITASSIKHILPISDSSSEKSGIQEKLMREGSEWAEWKEMRLKLTPKERAQSTAFMDLICSGIRGRKLTEEEKKDVRMAQEKYFTENLEAHSANPTCYFSREDISHAQASLPHDDRKAKSIKDLFPRFVLDYAERHLNA